jgi:hypothetical protein
MGGVVGVAGLAQGPQVLADPEDGDIELAEGAPQQNERASDQQTGDQHREGQQSEPTPGSFSARPTAAPTTEKPNRATTPRPAQ